jgi:general stress protein 26
MTEWTDDHTRHRSHAMTTATKADLTAVAALLAKLDICSFATQAEDGTLHGRPMSNNGEVEWDGDSWFFAAADSRKVAEIAADPHVVLGFTDSANATWVNLEGDAEIVRDDVEQKRRLWLDDLERWFPDGPEDPSVVLIKVHARHIDAWSREGDIVIDLPA